MAARGSATRHTRWCMTTLANSPQQPTSRDRRNRESRSPRTRLAAERQRRWAGHHSGAGFDSHSRQAVPPRGLFRASLGLPFLQSKRWTHVMTLQPDPIRLTPLARIRWLLAVWGLALVPGQLLAQGPTWTQAANVGPPSRTVHSMAYDSLRGRTVLFGGYGSSLFPAATWEWDGSNWAQVASAGPPGRDSFAMAYDSQRGRVVLFGGRSVPGSAVLPNETWEWNGSSWTQVAVSGPPARHLHAMSYDALRGKTVLFGGLNGSPFGDTWEWNGSTWTSVAANGPPARIRHSMAYDSVRGKTVLFGGDALSVFTEFGDTWEWDGAVWTNVATNGPGARTAHALAFDSQRGRTVMFGGVSGSGATHTEYGDTWEWGGNNWVLASTVGPSSRVHHAMAYDSQRGRTVLFGGGSSTPLGDTWEWGAGNPSTPATAASFGAGCGIPNLHLHPNPSARPIINSTAQVSMSNIPSPIAFVAVGWNRSMIGPFALPFSLLGYGMPGCYLLHSAEAAAQPVSFTSQTNATFSLPLPNWSGLIGLHLFLQGWAHAPGANVGNTVVSNAIEWGVGNS